MPQGNTLNDVFFIDQNTGWTVGDAGTILKSIDGGLNFDLINYPTHRNFYCVDFYNSNTGLIAGSSGMILKTVDGGNSWIEQVAPTDNILNSVYFTSPLEGWITSERSVGGWWSEILHTTNGGNSWEIQYSIDNDQGTFLDICFPDAYHGWAVGDSASKHPIRDVIMHTTDGGVTWEEQFPGLESYEKSIFFTDNEHGWIARDEGDILYTTDGGICWDHMFLNTNSTLGGIWFNDVDHGSVIGGNDAIFHIDNGSIVAVKEEQPVIQSSKFIVQSYPNPGYGIVDCRLSMVDGQWVTVRIYDVNGKELMNVLDEKLPAGEHTVRIDLSGFPNGIYFLRVSAGEESTSRKIVLKD